MKNKLIFIYEYVGLAFLYATIYLPVAAVLLVSLGLSFVSLVLKMLSGFVTSLSQVVLWISNLLPAGYWKPLAAHRQMTRQWRGEKEIPQQGRRETCACGNGRLHKNCCGERPR